MNTRRAVLRMLVGAILLAPSVVARAAPAPRFKAVAFDYFVLFDPNSIVPAVEKEFPGKGTEFARAWRAKQFEYCYLRSITRRQTDFYAVTEDALVYTARAMKLELGARAKSRLLDAYLHLRPWPDAVAALRRLKAAGVSVIAVSNFSAKMLRANAEAAGIAALFDDLITTQVNGTFKPEPAAYALGMKTLGLEKRDILFAAFGGWDAYGAKSFGYTTYWVDRFDLPVEELDVRPDGTSKDLAGLLEFELGNP